MALFTELVAGRIQQRRHEFLMGLAPEPQNSLEATLAAGVQTLWRPLRQFGSGNDAGRPPTGSAAAVDGSRAVRALSSGADWVVAQALLLGPNGLQLSAADTLLLRGDIERPAVDRCAALLMRSLELDLALKFAQSEESEACTALLLDGSLYADLPHLLYRLAVPGHEDLPLLVLQRYLDLFEQCDERGILLLGLAKSARSTVLRRAILDVAQPGQAAGRATRQREHRAMPSDATSAPSSDTFEEVPGEAPDADAGDDAQVPAIANRRNVRDALPPGLPTDAEILYRWTVGAGFTNPILLGTASFGHRSGPVTQDPTLLAEQFSGGQFSVAERRDILRRLRAAPAIGTFYVRLAPGEDALRVDALASAFGARDRRLLDFPHSMAPHETAEPLVGRLLDEYGGANVYNAALYVVDREVRLHAETVDRVYLSVLRGQLDVTIQYDRSTRRFML